MKEAYYFQHDTNATQDPKMFMLLTSCGVAGIGMYWIIIEMLHQQKDSRISEDAYKQMVKFYCSTHNQPEHVSNSIQQAFNTTGLLLIKDGFVYSERVLRNKELRSETIAKKSMAGKRSAEIRLMNRCSTGVQQIPTDVQLGKERKGKEKKGEGEADPPTVLEVREYAESEQLKADPQKFHDYQTAKGLWKTIVDWKAAFRYWDKTEHHTAPAESPIFQPLAYWQDKEADKIRWGNSFHDKHTSGGKCLFCGKSVKAPSICDCPGYSAGFSKHMEDYKC